MGHTEGYAAPETTDATERAAALAEKSGNLAQLVNLMILRGVSTLVAGDIPAASALANLALDLALREAGFIGSKVVNRSGEGLVRDIILSLVGAVVGDAIFTELGIVGVTGVNLTSIVVAAIGAMIVLVVYRAVIGRRAHA